MSDADLLARIQVYILSQRPSTFADFQAAVQQRATGLGLTVNDTDIQAFARTLRDQELIRQKNGKIEYAPFSELTPTKLPEKTTYVPDATILKSILKALSVHNRPKKWSSLRNMVVALAKCSSSETEKIIQYLQKQKIIQLNDNKVIYLK